MCGSMIGFSTLTIDNSANAGSVPEVFTRTNTNGDPTVPMPVSHVGSATIYCGEGINSPAPTPTPALTPTPTPHPGPDADANPDADTYADADAQRRRRPRHAQRAVAGSLAR